MKNYDLNKDNIDLLAPKFYDSPHCLMSEFEEDYNRVRYIKRLLSRYSSRGDLKERLILNHIIILGNVFGVEFTCKLLFYELDEEHWPVIKTFLLYLDYVKQEHIIYSINGQPVIVTDIGIDTVVSKALRSL